MTQQAALQVRTRAEVKAQIQTLTGQKSRVARAAADDTGTMATDVGKTGELWLYGVVGGWWRGFDAESVSTALRAMDDIDTLYVRIHSPGGYAPDGIAIGNLLRNHKATVVVVVDGLAASAASVIAIAGDEVVMCPGSQLMLHDASTIGWGNAAELRKAADWIDGQSQNYAGVYQYRAGGTVEQWRQVMVANDGTGTWYTAEDAVTAGLADSVGTRTAVGSPPTAPEDDLDDDEIYARAAHDLEVLDACVHPAVRAAWRGEHPKPPSASAVGSPPTQEGSPAVAFSDEQVTTMRQKLGVAENADEATILAALDEALEERTDSPAAATTGVPAGMSLVENGVLAELREGAAAGRSARDELNTQARDRVINDAIAQGKTTPARREHWEASWKADQDGTKALLAALEPGLAVPIAEIGHADEASADEDVTESAAYKNWSM